MEINKTIDAKWGYYAWLWRGSLRGKILAVLEHPMTSGQIRKAVEEIFGGDQITQRSVIRSMYCLLGIGLVREGKIDPIRGLGRLFKATSLGREMQELMSKRNFQGIGKLR